MELLIPIPLHFKFLKQCEILIVSNPAIDSSMVRVVDLGRENSHS